MQHFTIKSKYESLYISTRKELKDKILPFLVSIKKECLRVAGDSGNVLNDSERIMRESMI